MKQIPNDHSERSSGRRTFWDFLDPWLSKLTDGSGGLSRTVKIALAGAVSLYVASVLWRIWLISYAMTAFGVDIARIVPIDPHTAALVHKGLTVLFLFSPDSFLAYIFFNRNVRYWRAWTGVTLACAVAASWWATHDPGLGTHCYVMTPDRGVILSFVDKDGQCGVDPHSGLQTSAVTPSILMCLAALQRGVKAKKLSVADVNPGAMFDSGDGHSFYWFHRDRTAGFEFYDGPGFDQATSTPLEPVTPQNAEQVAGEIRQRQESERAEREKSATRDALASERRSAAERDQALAKLEQQRRTQDEETKALQARAAYRAAQAQEGKERQAQAERARTDALQAQARTEQLRAEQARMAEVERAREEAAARYQAAQARAEQERQDRVEAARRIEEQQRAEQLARDVRAGRKRPDGSWMPGCGEGGCNTTFGR